MGWDSSGMCDAGSDQFRTVIAHGEKFLAEHPSSPHRLDVTLALAMAYENWWSLSRARPGDDYVEPARYHDGAEAARQKAIGIYEQIAKMAADSPEATYARRCLPRLKLGVDIIGSLRGHNSGRKSQQIKDVSGDPAVSWNEQLTHGLLLVTNVARTNGP